MKTRLLTGILLSGMLIVAFILLTSFSSLNNQTKRSNTPGNVSFTVKTLPAGGNYAPKHVLAIWVEKEGSFIKTRKAMANQRKQYLYKWAAASGYNVTDAITGPTLSGHQTHTVEWDCTDLNGNIVADGDYTMIIEFTDKHAQGPFYEIVFNKGTEPVTITPPDQQYIINMELNYTPEIVVTSDFNADVTEACTEQEIIFTDLSNGATTWDWQFGDGAQPANANTQGPHSVTYSTSGPKTVSLTINNSVNTTKSDYISIEAQPMAEFQYDQNGNIVQFINTSQNAASYLWDFGDGNTSTLENPLHTYTQNGTYNVVLLSSNILCGDNSFGESIVVNSVSVEQRANNEFSLYPNPGNGLLFLNLNNISTIEEINLYNVQGKKLHAFEAGEIGNQHQLDLRFLSLDPGIYFLKIRTDDQNYFEKLILK
jgi:PKD repeat protein